MNRKAPHKIGWQQLYELYHRYFTNTANEKERTIIETWQAPNKCKNTLKLSKRIIEEDKIRTYKQLSERFGFDRSGLGDCHSSPFPAFVRWAAVAASILLLLGVGAGYWMYSVKQYDSKLFAQQYAKTCFSTSLSGMKKVKLSDGSVVMLNVGTTLSLIEKQFNKKQREVWLEGEAFFEVAKNPEKPFIVHSGKLSTVVRGTSFNVKAYSELKENTVSVRTGRVEVKTATKTLAVLTHNKQLTYNKTDDSCKPTQIDWTEAAAWMDGRLVLIDANATELKLRFKQHFAVTLVINSEVLSKAKFNVSFQKGCTLQEALDIVGNLYGLKYTINKSNVTICNYSGGSSR
jgi:transmembrane sensor